MLQTFIVFGFKLLQGRFNSLSLTGSFIPGKSGGVTSTTGGMSRALSSPDGRVVGTNNQGKCSQATH